MDVPAGGSSGDGFGAGASRWWRRLAGAGVVALVALALGASLTGEDGTDRGTGFWALLVVGCTYAGVPISRLVAGASRGGELVLRHAGAGTGVGLVLAAALTVWGRDVEWLGVWLLICLPAGALVGAATAATALAVPRRFAVWPALLGVLATAALAWLTFRPQQFDDLVAVDATEEVAAAGGATGVAERFAAAVDRAGRGSDLREAGWWEAVANEVSAGFGRSRPALTSTDVEDLPTSAVTGAPVRVVTVRVRGEGSACVVVDADATRVLDGACEDHDLVRP